MSAIVGFTGSGTTEIDAMLQQLRHWQPDREQAYKDHDINLAVLELFNTRESVLTPQPFLYKDYIIVACCRIDNRQQLAAELGIPDINTVADIHFIICAYEKWGSDCVRHLYGDFAFVIWNRQQKKLFGARDHIGIKTLYYSQYDDQFIFCSEIKGIAAHPSFKGLHNQNYFVQSLVNESCLPATETSFANIHLLAAGHFLEWQNNSLHIEKYWEPGAYLPDIPADDESRKKLFSQLLFQAVQCRLRSAKKIGAEVSGGLDSTAVAGIAMQLLGKGTEFYSFCYGKPHAADSINYDDADIVREFCNDNGILDYLTVVNEENYPWHVAEKLLMNVYDNGESGVPLMTGSFLPIAHDNNIGVILSGHGGDHVVSSVAKGFYIQNAVKHNYRVLWNNLSRQFGLTGGIPRFIYYTVRALDANVIIKTNKKIIIKRFEKHGLNADVINQYTLGTQQTSPNDLLHTAACMLDKYKVYVQYPLMVKRAYHHDLTGKHYNLEYRFPLLDVRLLEYTMALATWVEGAYDTQRDFFTELVKEYVPAKTISVKKSKVPTTPFIKAFNKKNYEEIKKRRMAVNSPLTAYFAPRKLDNLDVSTNIKLLALGNIYNRITR